MDRIQAKDDPRALAAVEEVISVLDKHGFTLSHEDAHGAFILERRRVPAHAAYNDGWLRDAWVEPE